MKTKKRNAKKSKAAAKKYLDSQLKILNRFGAVGNLSAKKYRAILRDVERATLVS
jgi:hypothetical protein